MHASVIGCLRCDILRGGRVGYTTTQGPDEVPRPSPLERGAMADRGPTPSPSPHDPRMRGFRDRTAVGDVVDVIERRVERLAAESVELRQAHGRVLASGVLAGAPVPPFDRA